MRFSQRIGKAPKAKELQIEGMDKELRNRLWNAFYMHILLVLKKNSGAYGILSYKDKHFIAGIFHSFYKTRVDEVPNLYASVLDSFKSKFFSQEWYEIYDFLEYIINTISHNDEYDKEYLVDHLNMIFEEEFSGYRVVNNLVVPISNQVEIGEIEEALNFTSIEGVNIHLTNSLNKLSDKIYPDYRNSIKESISAVESVCRVFTGESTLGKAFKKLETNEVYINQQLKSGFEKIYAYTNDKESGIRHSIVEEFKNPDFEDAKYMLVACSSFVNYLVGKHNKVKR